MTEKLAISFLNLIGHCKENVYYVYFLAVWCEIDLYLALECTRYILRNTRKEGLIFSIEALK